MERSQVQNRLEALKSIKELVVILNEIKNEVFHISKYPITSGELFHFCNPKPNVERFHTFKIRKKSGGTREISAPKYKLGLILKVLNELFKSMYKPSDSTMGFTEGKSVVTNASVHVGHNYVLNIDLENFFTSISQGRVWARLQLPPFNFSRNVASILAGICCDKNADGSKNVLPQGAPTSPILSNAVCDKLDRRMRGVAKRFGLHYSRYADDMSFSSMHNVYQEDGEFMKEIRRIVSAEGFTMNENKTRLLRTKERQEVTGLTVNNRVNVTRKYIRDLRKYIFIWEKNGYALAYAYFYRHYKQEKGYIKKGEPVMENVIGGKLNYLKMIKGSSNEAYQKLQNRFNALQQIVYIDSETDKSEKYIYVQSYTVPEFEKLFYTNISLDITQKGKIIGLCNLVGVDKEICISKSTQAFLRQKMKKYTLAELPEQDFFKEFFVTLCRRKGKNMWLISKFSLKRSSCLSLQDARIDIDALLEIWEKKGIKAAAVALNKNVFGDDAISREYSKIAEKGEQRTEIDLSN